MSGHIPCRCGKPITDGAHLCSACVATLRENLERIADRWDDLTDALGSNEPGGDEKGRQKHGQVMTGTPFNEAVSRARKACNEVLWFAVQVIRDDLDDAGRDFAPPRWKDEGDMARWLLTWQVPHLTATTARETAEEIADDLAKAEKATFRALNPSRWVSVTDCTMHTTDEHGARVPCTGVLVAKVGTGRMPDLQCSEDPDHVIKPTTWERAGWKRRFSQALNPEGLRRLAERMKA